MKEGRSHISNPGCYLKTLKSRRKQLIQRHRNEIRTVKGRVWEQVGSEWLVIYLSGTAKERETVSAERDEQRGSHLAVELRGKMEFFE